MFLALREIRHQPARFLLITIVVVLVSYLAFFLTGLAYGLASAYSEAIRNWSASGVVTTSTANQNLMASRLSARQLEVASEQAPAAAPLLLQAVVYVPSAGQEERANAYLFAVDEAGPAAPAVTEGRYPRAGGEILLDATLAREGFALGSQVQLADSDTTWQVVGFTDAQRFQTAPVMYVSIDQYRDRFGYLLAGRDGEVAAHAVVLGPNATPDAAALEEAGLEYLSSDALISALPGYNAQVLTFSLMIGSLIGIATLVLAIFIYVLTLQKRSLFGIMKAQGIRTSYIVVSGAVQTFFLTMVGVGIGLALAFGTSVALAGKVPFAVSPVLFAGVIGAFLLGTVIGGLVPIRTISRIDPIEAIG
ncbi:ABC transporter permease [Buchananella hordeovulneris]|uniref:Uncharacterized protein n=1 Tax=Buchananella hordeovulneris TaxID=52770 RepID=A0A1Q5PTV0_9ACTO|nr:ABC transporter permease [Buchananella hordeovulneris]OKL50984.1 hypothetical protein BSZ40_09480 [Buchananella hordeovulneris]